MLKSQGSPPGEAAAPIEPGHDANTAEEPEKATSVGRPGQRDQAGLGSYVGARINELNSLLGRPPVDPAVFESGAFWESDPIGSLVPEFREVLEQSNRANERLRIVHEDLRAVFDLAGVAILVVDEDYNVTAHNKLAFQDLSAGTESIIYRRCHEMICRSSTPPRNCILRSRKEKFQRNELRGVRLGDRIYDVVATPVLDDTGAILHNVITYVDITEHQLALDAVTRSEHRFRDLFENANDLIQVSTPEGQLLYVNRAWRKATGHGDVTGRSVLEMVAPGRLEEYARAVRSSMKRPDGVRLETEFVTAEGRQILLDGNLTSSENEDGQTLVRAIFRDITRQRRLEEEISTAQRMDTVGQLAGGIAHDFNNALTAVLGNLTLARMYEASGYPAKDKLEKAEQAVLRARGLTRQLLTFATGGEPVKREVKLTPFLQDAVAFALSGSNVKCDFLISGELASIEVDAGQLEQVVQNLVLNGVQAMSGGGTLKVECKNIYLDEYSPYALPTGEYVVISIKDQGIGIPPENVERVFDPFFTTKDGGKGLGLATAFSIIRKHAGTITVESTIGRGARFDILLPAKKEPEQPQRMGPKASGQGGRILVMDDEQEIRDLLRALLVHLGYEVETTPDGARLLASYEAALKEGRPYDLVIMDLTVPGGMGGREAMERLKKIDPEVVAVVSSGYSSDPVMSDHKKYGFSGVAGKPYSVDTVAELVRELIAGRKERAGFH